jgi:cytochrome c5
MRVVAVVLTLSWAVVACEVDLGTCDMTAATKVAYLNGTPYHEGQALVNASCAGGTCHASGATGAGRNGAPHGLNFDVQPLTKSSTAADVSVLKAGLTEIRAEASELWALIDEGEMPPGKVGERPPPALYSDMGGTLKVDLANSKEKVRNWLACQAPIVAGTTDSAVMADAMALGKVVPPGTAAIAANFASIYDNLLTTCTACHSAVGTYKQLVLDFASRDAAFATLVNKIAVTGSGGMCSGRTLVKPMDCKNSLLYQKLAATGAPELCGASMPFGAPMVSADVAKAVCDWIDAGAAK